MKRTQTIVKAVGLVLMAAAASSCQDMNTFFTGEKFSRAPEGSPRVETELTVRVDDSFVEALTSVEQAVELGGAASDLVLSLADVGTRFYPVRSEDYASKDVRPRYVMVVNIDDLDFEFGSETVLPDAALMVEAEDGAPIQVEQPEPVVRVFLKSVTCSATASIEKRRKHAPPLVVGQSQGKGEVRVTARAEDDTSEMYTVRAKSGHAVSVRRQDVLDAAERAVVDALRDMVRAVDREFEVERAAQRRGAE